MELALETLHLFIIIIIIIPLGDPLIQVITFDSDHWKEILTNLTIFFDSCVAPYLLGIQNVAVLSSM